MKKVAILGVGLVLFGMVSVSLVDSNSSSSSIKTEKNSDPSPDAIEAAKKALDAEKKVEGVFYDPGAFAQWEIGMFNDGSSRVGYAYYVCDVLKEKGASTSKTRVKIIDIANVLVPAKDRNMRGMGTVACDDYNVISAGDMRPVAVP